MNVILFSAFYITPCPHDYRRFKMAAAGAAVGAGKKLALGALGAFSGVGAAVAYKLDQSVKVHVK